MAGTQAEVQQFCREAGEILEQMKTLYRRLAQLQGRAPAAFGIRGPVQLAREYAARGIQQLSWATARLCGKCKRM